MLTRRQWLAALPVARVAAVNAAETPRPLGVRLYSVRGNLHQEADKTLKAIARIGYREVEGYNRLETITLGPRIKDAGLAVRSCRTETPLITADWENYPEYKQVTLTEAIDSVAGAGVEYFLMGYIAPGARGDAEDFYRRTADRMSAAAELCRKSGLKFAWQNHAFEFEGRPGFRAIDFFKARLDPKLVRLELDPFWASLAGQDPIQLLKDWKGRVSLLHLNDKAKGVPSQFSETIGQGAWAEPGSGALDLRAIVKAARAAGAQHFFAGQDDSAGDPLDGLRGSFSYLQKLVS
ncbi:MAG TPA: sugar phosphate isomerase/epimerase [Bryobacteraceae bacterium]|nr:sugar phosphate isomerase/epimerase [Bryobacteraceae bacterium]